MRFAERFKALRRRGNLTQGEVADRLDMRQASISDWERGASEPPAGRIAEIAAALDAEPYELVLEEEQSNMIRDFFRFMFSQRESLHVVREFEATGTNGRRFTSEEAGIDAQGKDNSQMIAASCVRKWARIARPRIISLPKWRQSATMSNRSQSAPKLGYSPVPLDFQAAHNRSDSASEVG